MSWDHLLPGVAIDGTKVLVIRKQVGGPLEWVLDGEAITVDEIKRRLPGIYSLFMADADAEHVSDDPRAREEDQMQEWLSRQTRPAQACVYRLLRVAGWNDSEAQRELERAWPRVRVLR